MTFKKKTKNCFFKRREVQKMEALLVLFESIRSSIVLFYERKSIF